MWSAYVKWLKDKHILHPDRVVSEVQCRYTIGTRTSLLMNTYVSLNQQHFTTDVWAIHLLDILEAWMVEIAYGDTLIDGIIRSSEEGSPDELLWSEENNLELSHGSCIKNFLCIKYTTHHLAFEGVEGVRVSLLDIRDKANIIQQDVKTLMQHIRNL